MEKKLKLQKQIQTSKDNILSKLGVINLKNIDFYSIQGFRIVKAFVVFQSTDQRDKILESFAEVWLFCFGNLRTKNWTHWKPVSPH